MVQTTKTFDQATVNAVWRKGRVIDKYDAATWRRDAAGSVMKYSQYGDTNAEYGWEIDHMIPVARGGSDDLSNLQPLHWKNNRRKGDSYAWSWS